VSATQTEQAISDELLRIHRETHGSGANRARTYVLPEAVVCFLEEIELLPNEEYLIGKGHTEIVLDMRREYQAAVSAAFTAAVERATGRRVTHFSSDTSVDPNFSVEVFKLA
jgi:uncharacterized protein YbcI